jgi:hypothetical protein
MSTILKALKKAEEGMAKNTLPGKILSAGSVPSGAGARARVRLVTTILFSALVLVAGLAYYLQLHGRAGKSRDSSPQPAAAPTAARVVGIAGGEGEPDGAALPPLHLSGVLWDKTEPLAILNGRPLTVGGEIDGARVVKIGLDGVQVNYRGREYTLSVE